MNSINSSMTVVVACVEWQTGIGVGLKDASVQEGGVGGNELRAGSGVVS